MEIRYPLFHPLPDHESDRDVLKIDDTGEAVLGPFTSLVLLGLPLAPYFSFPSSLLRGRKPAPAHHIFPQKLWQYGLSVRFVLGVDSLSRLFMTSF